MSILLIPDRDSSDHLHSSAGLEVGNSSNLHRFAVLGGELVAKERVEVDGRLSFLGGGCADDFTEKPSTDGTLSNSFRTA